MRKVFSSIILLFSIIGVARAQSVYQPYSYQFYQKLNEDVYSTSSRQHSSLKPFFADDSLLKHHYDSLMNLGNDSKQHSWGYRKLFNEHLIDVKSPGSTFYADLLPDIGVGRDLSGHLNTSNLSIGAQIGGTVGNKFSYNLSGYQGSAVIPEYISTYINQVGIVPGQAYARTYSTYGYDWSYLTAVVSYTPVKYLNISAGRDKTFIGDGYRSELLSDFASPYPFFKLTATLGNVRYMAMYTLMNDPVAEANSGNNISRKKFAVFHYLDWNVSNRVSLGFFDAVISYTVDDSGNKRPFDFTYLNPVIFLRPLEASNGSPDNALIGITGKYKITDNITAYGQFALDEFQSKDFFSSNGSSRNKYGWQFGFRGSQFLGVNGLNYLFEYNTAKPFTYSERSYIENYSDNSEPLAHPWGANFREWVGLLNYSYKRFDFSGEADFGRYGFDLNGQNFGKDIFELYLNPARAVGNASLSYGNYTGQGLTTNLVYMEGKIAYLLNPKYNLRIELGAIYRTEDNVQFKDRTTWVTIGLRSSFRNLYTDLASYHAH
ncbi:gliding motility protein RemB [Mucilaginibacter sp.]|uniref:gliding motility protein RemB n=1 Tax=Mucilaginibacter sp. TaxID=1882438 RepID=UPI00284D0236|nr:gliding motility protein RemB [Mucilaginibacter sp.]MDR3697781.1 gliding motility protein RemB [Mucilaginibacter sp.]